MVRFRHADLRIRPGALLLADHERNHSRQIGLERQELQIHHQRQVIFEDRRRAQRLFERGQLDAAVLLRHLDAAFHVANRIGVFVDLALILRPQFPLQVRQLPGHGIENALVLLQSPLARGSVRAAAIAEQLLENGSRIPLHGQGLRGAAPGQRVQVGAAQIAGACARVGGRVHGHFERGQLRFLSEVAAEQLIDGDVGDDFDFVAAAARSAREKRSGSARVDVVPAGLDARKAPASDRL